MINTHAYDENYQPYKKAIESSEEIYAYDFPEEWFGTADFRILHEGAYWHLYNINTERALYEITEETPAARIYTGGNLYINASQLNNESSKISAGKDIFLTGNDFLNSSYSNWIKDDFIDYEIQGGILNNSMNGRRTAWNTCFTEAEQYPATIIAGGNVALDFNNSIQFKMLLPELLDEWSDHVLLKEKTLTAVQGNNIVLHAKTITNSELIQARGDITLIADDTIDLNNSALRGRDISLTALNNINSLLGEITGRNIMLLSRQGDIQFKQDYNKEYYQQADQSRIIGQINAGGDFSAIAGKNINLTDTLLHPANNITMSASHDINITRNKELLRQIDFGRIFTREENIQHYNQLLSLPGKLKSHQDLTLSAGNNLRLQGITLEAGKEINLHAAQDIDLALRDISYQFDVLPNEDFSYPEDDYQYFFHAIRPADLNTKINAKGNLLINAGRDILARASNIAADNNMTLLAGRNIQLAAQLYAGEGQRQDKHAVTRLQAGKALNAVASDQLLTYGAELTSGGDMILTSGGNMRFESLLNEQHQGGGDNFSYNKLQQPTQLNSGGTLTLISNGSILFQATQLVAKKVMDIAAEGGYLFAQAMEETSHAEERWSTRKWWGRKKSHHNVHHVATNKVTEFTADGDISLLSRDDSTYQASKIAAGQNAKLTSTHGKVIFEAVKNTTFEQKTSLSKGFYIKNTDKGYQEDKWVLPSVRAGGELTVNGAQGISADVKAQNNQSVQAAINELATIPGNEWLKDLHLRDDVQWQKVMDAYHSWDHQSEHLNPVVAALIAIGVAVATSGSSLVAHANIAVGSGAAGGAVTAGMSSLAAQAAVALVEHKGDLSKTFKDLGSKESVRSLVTSMAVGGALSGFDSLMGFDTAADSVSAAKLPRLSQGDWSKVAQRVAGQSLINSSLNTGINGGSFKDNFTAALLANLGSQIHAEGANLIGDNGRVLGGAGKALSHAVVAGVAAEIGGGNVKGAAAGALAAELAGVMMGENFIGPQNWQEKQAQLSRVAGAIAGSLVTGKAEGAYSGANAAEVVERFNRQLHLAEIKAVNELAKGNQVKQERLLAASCRQVNCTAQESLNSAERARAEALMAKHPETPEEDRILTNYWIQKEKQRFGNYPALTGFDQIQLFTYTDTDKLSDSQTFAKNQWVEETSNLTGWSKESVEALGLSMSLAGLVRKKGSYPAGISFNINQKNHLAKFDGITRKGISGTHNANAFNQAATANNVRIVKQTSSDVKGITNIEYQIPSYNRAGNITGYKSQVFIKTVYDPKVLSDQKMLELGQQAVSSGYNRAVSLGLREFEATADGIKFQVYLDQRTGTVTNFFPVAK